MATSSTAVGSEGAPTYLNTADPDRTVTAFASNTIAAKDYVPVWLGRMADDVTLEGTMMNGAVRGAETVRAILGHVRSLRALRRYPRRGALRVQRGLIPQSDRSVLNLEVD